MSEFVNVPKAFNGSKEQKDRNFRSHRWGEDNRCLICDSKISHTAAEYPCGEEPPRLEIPLEKYQKLQQIKLDYLRNIIDRETAIEMQKAVDNSVE